jgi:hypothetical protein
MTKIEVDIAKRMKRAPKEIQRPDEPLDGAGDELNNDEWIKLGGAMEK